MLARDLAAELMKTPDQEVLILIRGSYHGVTAPGSEATGQHRNAVRIVYAGMSVRYHVEEGSNDPQGNTPTTWTEIPDGVYDTRDEAQARVELETTRAGHFILIRIVEK